MKFTKIMSLVLAIAMIAVCFVACGGNGGQTTTSSTTSSSTTSSSTTSSSTTSSSTTSSSTTTSTETPKPDPKPTEDVVLYENDFESDAGSDTPLNGSQIAVVGGKLSFDNYSNVTWNKSVTLDNETGKIVITFDINPNLQKDYTIIAINGQAVLSAANGGVKISGDTLGGNVGYNKDHIARKVTVEIDPATGDCTVTYAHPDGAQWGEVHTETVNVGAISGTLEITLGTPGSAGRNGFRIDNLKVVQAKAE